MTYLKRESGKKKMGVARKSNILNGLNLTLRKIAN